MMAAFHSDVPVPGPSHCAGWLAGTARRKALEVKESRRFFAPRVSDTCAFFETRGKNTWRGKGVTAVLAGGTSERDRARIHALAAPIGWLTAR